MNAMLPVAEKMLGTTGEFYPYGGAMACDGSISSVAAYDGDTRPTSSNLIALLEDAFRDGALKRTYMISIGQKFL